MKTITVENRPYLLLTPAPLTTTDSVKSVMLADWCTWDDDYNSIVQDIRAHLVRLAGCGDDYTSVLLQGSGTYAVEGTMQSAVGRSGKVLILANGAYGTRMVTIARRAGINHAVYDAGEVARHDPEHLAAQLEADPAITHVCAVHVETTTGMLNDISALCAVTKRAGRVFILDSMSGFGGIPIDVASMGIDYLVSSANKCIQGVPGFGFIIARRKELERCAGNAVSLSLDIHDQWVTMEKDHGKWRFTSPTHTVRAFAQALAELEVEGGVAARHARYQENHRLLVSGMRSLGFDTLLTDTFHSPIITSFLAPLAQGYSFNQFYALLKEKGFVIYPGKVTDAETFRIGNIGDVHPHDMIRLIDAIAGSLFWL